MKELNLSIVQKEQLKALNKSYKKQLITLKQNEDITVRESRDRKTTLQKEKKEKVMDLLSADQKNILVQAKKLQRAKREMKVAKKIDKIKVNLNLSDEQVAKIKTTEQSTNAEVNAVKENNQLSRIQKLQRLKALKKQNKKVFRNILTPEQFSKMKEIKRLKIENKQPI